MAVRRNAFMMSRKNAPDSGTCRSLCGAGPYRSVIACMFANAVAVDPMLNPTNAAGEDFFNNLLDSPLRVVLAVTPEKKIMYNAALAGRHMAGTVSEEELGARLESDRVRMNKERTARGLKPR